MSTKKKNSLSKIWKTIKPKSIKGSIKNFLDRKINIDKVVRKQNHAKYQKFFTEESPKLDISGKRVVFVFDENSRLFVGLADRLRGIVMTYNCVKALRERGHKIDFSINFTYPFDLSKYLIPNTFDWRIAKSDISYNSTQAEAIQLTTVHIYDCHFNVHSVINYLKDRIKSSKYNQIHISTNIPVRGKYHVKNFSPSFHELFKPSPLLQAELDRHLGMILDGGGYINTTLRFQNLLGDFYEGENFKPLESEEEKSTLIEQCMEQVVKIHLRHPDKKILVTSDSRTFLDEAAKKPYVYTIDGKLAHMAYTQDTNLDLHLKPFVDFMMISHAEKIYLLRTGQMYKSGFPRSASKINNCEFEYIEF